MKHFLNYLKILTVPLLVVLFFFFAGAREANAASQQQQQVANCVVSAIAASVAANVAGAATELLPTGSFASTNAVTVSNPVAAGSVLGLAATAEGAGTALSVPTANKAEYLLLSGLYTVTAAKTNFETGAKMKLDSLAYAVAQCTLNELTNNLVTWIKGGFNGSPSFAVDVQGLFNDIALGVTDEFLKDVRGLATCKLNFIDDLKNEIPLIPKKKQIDLKCPFPADATTFTASQFYNDFNTLGWRGMQAALENGGNPFGINVATSAELARRQAEAKATNDQKLNWSNGFADLVDTSDPTKCNYPQDVLLALQSGDMTDEGIPYTQEQKNYLAKKYCPTTTPGKIIGDSLMKSIGAEQDRIGFADNMNKIISALIGQLTKQTVKGIFASVNNAQRSGALGGGSTGSWSTLGSAQSSNVSAFKLDVPFVTTGGISNVTPTSAVIRGYINYPTDPGFGWFEWTDSILSIRTGNPAPSTNILTSYEYIPGADPAAGGSTNYSLSLTGLTPETTYYFRAVGSTGGKTWLSEPKQFTTPKI